MDDREVIDKYHGLTQIEDQFRVMKSTLETRPVYVRTPEHVDAHLLICCIFSNFAPDFLYISVHHMPAVIPECQLFDK